MIGPQKSWLADGKRLHLHHGPIDLIIGAEGPDAAAAFKASSERFDTILQGLVDELPMLRSPMRIGLKVRDPVGARMIEAVRPYSDRFVTSMAAVAGAVADEILNAMCAAGRLEKTYVNNGGDIAFHLAPTRSFRAMGPAGLIEIAHSDGAGGMATSGWSGRSHSLGIADAVTVVARSAAAADVAATLIANAVDLPGHPAITRAPASDENPDSDLGDRLVTKSVGTLHPDEVASALDRGARAARVFQRKGLILQSILALKGETRTITKQVKDLTHA